MDETLTYELSLREHFHSLQSCRELGLIETLSRLLHQMQYRAAKQGIAFKGFGFHTLRRTYATFRHLLGADQRPHAALVAAMGHANAEMADHYIQADVDVVDKLRDLVFFSGVTREKLV